MNDFESIVGQDSIKKYLRECILSSDISHAYIINGERGMGADRLARVFAETLDCLFIEKERESGGLGDNLSRINPCHKCHSCIQAEAATNPDIRYIAPEDNGSGAGKKTIGVGEIRQKLINDVYIKPYEYKYKIYIISEADKLTAESQNALLKTLEDPPEYAVIILLTVNADLLLDTVRSRCVRLDLRPVDDKDVEKYLKERFPGRSEDDIRFAASFSRGRVDKAVEFLEDKELGEIKSKLLSFLKRLPEETFADTADIIYEIEKVKDKYLDDCLDILFFWYRDVLVFKSTRDPNRLIFKDDIPDISKQAKRLSYDGIKNIEEAVDKVKVRLNANVNFDIVFELLFMTIFEELGQGNKL